MATVFYEANDALLALKLRAKTDVILGDLGIDLLVILKGAWQLHRSLIWIWEGAQEGSIN